MLKVWKKNENNIENFKNIPRTTMRYTIEKNGRKKEKNIKKMNY